MKIKTIVFRRKFILREIMILWGRYLCWCFNRVWLEMFIVIFSLGYRFRYNIKFYLVIRRFWVFDME